MNTKSIFVILLMAFNTANAGTDAVLLAKLIGQSAAQLKELKEILEINNATLDQVEKANRKVQQTRYRVLRAKYLMDSVKTVSGNKVENTEQALRTMRQSKYYMKESKSFYRELESMSESEREKLLADLDQLADNSKDLEEQILDKKKSILMNKVNLDRVQSNDLELKKIQNLVDYNEDVSTQPLDPHSAQVETAKNTALSNKILLNNTQLQHEQLKEATRFHNLIEEEQLDKLKERQREKKIWEIDPI